MMSAKLLYPQYPSIYLINPAENDKPSKDTSHWAGYLTLENYQNVADLIQAILGAHKHFVHTTFYEPNKNASLPVQQWRTHPELSVRKTQNYVLLSLSDWDTPFYSQLKDGEGCSAYYYGNYVYIASGLIAVKARYGSNSDSMLIFHNYIPVGWTIA